ncbi:TetR/AcrR family transcriptional regulator [Kibdelosporangium phytohabitans]|uniref:TetR family transcriptional regulator n=1 Tax=Kibdelosporangium phytohabitans TaxID=860235 RepID=A0A0N9I1Q5_9PSEU|nr:TetR/AcrR family transcriptional regulator [Kibdelosporangium phytohabitans]ALG09577.1 TetR family transcriptional regulator [Kibdelosporangium phytohabitans]MBE1469095.1 AcrR family transcriptional regulator [Kibdelosporangium phytohabitans]
MTSEQRRIQPRKQPRQVRAELTRQRILAAAAHIFAEYGYAAGTTNRIAEQARVSIGSLYQYYPNKDAILAELLTRHLDGDRATETLRAHKDRPDPLEQIVRVFVHTVIDNHLDDPELLRIMIEQAPRSAELLERITRLEWEMVGDLRDLLNRHPEVRVHDKDTAARLVASTVELTVHQLVASPGSIDLTRLENELVAMVTGYLRADR